MRSWALCAYANQRFALKEQSARGSLECKHSDSLTLDYVASGSGGRAVADRILDGPPTETKKPPGWVAFLLVDHLGLEPRTDRL